MAAMCAIAVYAFHRKWLSAAVIPVVLLGLFIADVGRVNAKFLFLVNVPCQGKGNKDPDNGIPSFPWLEPIPGSAHERN